MDICWHEIFGISPAVEDDAMMLVDLDGSEKAAHSTSRYLFAEQKVSFINSQSHRFRHAAVLSVSIYPKDVACRAKKSVFKFELSMETDQAASEKYIQGFRSIETTTVAVQIHWNCSVAQATVGHHIFQVLDCVNTLGLLTDLRVSSFLSVEAATRVSYYLQSNPNLSCFQLGYHLGDHPQMRETAEIVGRALAANTSLKEFRFMPFSVSSAPYSTTFQDNLVDPTIRPILHGVSQNTCLERLHLWAPGVIPCSVLEATIVDHPSIKDLYLSGETAQWNHDEGVDPCIAFQHLAWQILSSPLCRLEKLKLSDFHMDTQKVDMLLSSLWRGHPLQVLDVSGNFLSSLHFPHFLSQHPCDECYDKRLRLLIVERQCNAFASLEYDLTYAHDQTRCRQHCHDMMKLLSAKPGLSIQHSKMSAMLQNTTILPTILPPPLSSRPPIRLRSIDQVQWLLDHHRVVPPQIRTVNENFCHALWPLILARCTSLLVNPSDCSDAVATNATTRRQASVMYQIFQDWSCLMLVQGEDSKQRRMTITT